MLPVGCYHRIKAICETADNTHALLTGYTTSLSL